MVEGLLIVFFVVVLLAELRFRQPAIRGLGVGVSLVAIFLSTDLGPASRRALDNPQRVSIGRADVLQRTASEYASGVLVMKREAERDLRTIAIPAIALAWLAAVPLFRSGGQALLPSRNDQS
jgi:hypothetical protein